MGNAKSYDVILYGCYGRTGYEVLGENVTIQKAKTLRVKQEKNGLKVNEYIVILPNY